MTTLTDDRILLFGTHATLVKVTDATEARRTAAGLRTLLAAQVSSVVPGANTVLVQTQPTGDLSGTRLREVVAEALTDLDATTVEDTGRTVVIPVRYNGEDLASVADLLGVSTDEVVTRHSNPTYTVDFLGFAPGFPYLSGLDPFLADVPRLDTPRTRVPAGSVGLAAAKTCVYPTVSPGGWRLLGSTSMTLFDPSNDRNPCALAPGDRVRFATVR